MATELATRPPAFVDGKTQSANDLRLNVLSGSGGATPLQSRAGVRPSGGNPGLVAALVTPVMKVRVNAGIADVPSSSVTGGFYRVSWDQVDLDIDPSSAQSRTDLIIVEVVDTGTSAATGKVRVLKGTSGAGRPTNAVVNAHWWSLGSVAVRVNAEGTGNIRPQDVTPELQYAVAPGAPIPVSTQAEEDALTTFPLRTISRLDLGVLKVRNAANTAWQTVAFTGVPLPRAQITSTRTGIASATLSGLGVTSGFTTTENVAGLTTEVTDGVQLNQTGIYNVHAASKLTVGTSLGPSSLSIVGAADTTVYARVPMGGGAETDGSVGVAPLVVTAVPFVVRFLSYVTTGGGTAYTRQTTVDIVRVGDV